MSELEKEQLKDLLKEKAKAAPNSREYFELIDRYNRMLGSIIDQGLDEPIEDDLLLDDSLLDEKYLKFEKKWKQDHPYTIERFINEQCSYICLVEIQEIESHTARARVLHLYKGELPDEIDIRFFIPWGLNAWFKVKEKSIIFLDDKLISLGLLGRMPVIEIDGTEYAASYSEDRNFWPDNIQIRQHILDGERVLLIEMESVERVMRNGSIPNLSPESTARGGLLATIILDSGCFLKFDRKTFAEIGYSQSSNSILKIRVLEDGTEVSIPKTLEPDKHCNIEIRHVMANGMIKKKGLKTSHNFHRELLHLKDLPGEYVPVDRSKFDCVIRFSSGLFCAALVKPRIFKTYKRQANGKYSPEDFEKSIAHNIFVHFKLEKGEALELARDGKVFWSSKNSYAGDPLDVEIMAGNTAAEDEEFYEMPNLDAPPMYPCPFSSIDV